MKSNNLSGRFEDVEFENVECLICGCDDSVPAGSVETFGNSYEYKLCADCGLKYMDPRPSQNWYEAHYAKVFWKYKMENRSWQEKKKKWRLRDLFRKDAAGRQKHQEGRLKYLVPLLEKNTNLGPGTSMLDIGCAFGAIGKGLSESFGCKVYGVEPNVDAQAVASNENDIEIIAKNAEELIGLDTHDGKFKLILLSNVLENILAPKPILSALKNMLSDDGVVCIHMPNFFFYDAMNPYHPYIYSPDTLARLCNEAGLKVTSTENRPMVDGNGEIQKPFQKTDLFMTVFASSADSSEKFAKADTSFLLEKQRVSLQAYAAYRHKPARKITRKIRMLLAGRDARDSN